jgi:hypothetical protein
MYQLFFQIPVQIFLNSLPNFCEDVKIKMQVVDGVQYGRGDLVSLIEMTKIGSGKV